MQYFFSQTGQTTHYSSEKILAQKLINWQTVNKVLKKSKIHLSQEKTEQLDNGEPGIFDKLSQEVKDKVDTKFDKEKDESLNLEKQSSRTQQETLGQVIFQEAFIIQVCIFLIIFCV